MKLRKALLIALGVVLIIGVGVGIWLLVNKVSTSKEQKAIRNINVGALKDDNEKKIGTIIYAGAKKDGDIKTTDNSSTATLTSTDSVDGAFNIYYQDILNRYKTYAVSKKDITKDDALNKTARVIVCSGQSGSITVTIWGKTNGLTQIEIVTTSDFK